jgi:HK97 gp10 family phage protein
MKIQNRDRLKAKLAAIPKEARAEIHKALDKSATEMVETAQSFAPVKTGALRNSIGKTFGEYAADNPNVRGVTAGGGVGDPDLTVTIHAGDQEAYYAAFVEFGTKAAPAHPYFFPAWRLLKKRVLSRIKRATTKAAKKVAGQS